jgi:heat shock protein HspQ
MRYSLSRNSVISSWYAVGVLLEKMLYAFLRIVVDLPRPTLHRTGMRTGYVEGFKVLAQVVHPLMGHTGFLSDLERRYTGSQAGFDCAADRVRTFENSPALD